MSTKKDWVELAMERCEAATPGPWRAVDGDDMEGAVIEKANDAEAEHMRRVAQADGYEENENADFIAHARTDLPRALAAVRAADELAEYIEAVLDMSDRHQPGLAGALAAYRLARSGV